MTPESCSWLCAWFSKLGGRESPVGARKYFIENSSVPTGSRCFHAPTVSRDYL
jgi:hypothetical protein